MSRLALVVLLLLAAGPAAGQANVTRFTGVVLDAATGQPLPGAHVFLSGTMIGTAAGSRGRFELQHVPAGAHRLHASMVGYGGVSIDTLVVAGQTYVVTLRLAPEVVELGDVRVEAERDRRWQRQRRRFVRLFVGETASARETELVNPEVLAFGGRWGRLTARADSPLVIVNRALGYRLRYYLEHFERSGGRIRFDGEPLFEPLVPTDSHDATRWRANRQRAFRGSLRHLLLALIDGRSRDEGFTLYRRSRPGMHGHRWRVDPDGLVRPDTADTWLLDFNGELEVHFHGEPESIAYARRRHPGSARARDSQRSWMWLSDGATLIDRFGEPLDPYGITVSGYFAFESVAAHMLPREYAAR